MTGCFVLLIVFLSLGANDYTNSSTSFGSVSITPGSGVGIGSRDLHLLEARLGSALSGSREKTMTMDQLLERLGAVKGIAGGFSASCPVHNDGNPSLSVTDGGDRILIHCHAGCSTPDILDALGLKWTHLFYESDPEEQAWREAVRSVMGRRWSEPEAEYVYTDELGREVERKIRYPGKRFKTERKRYPYHLLKLIGRDYRKPVYIVEGEKDVEALEAVGCTATTGGATTGWEGWWETYLEGADVVIVQDKDDPGREHAKNVAELLYHAAKSIRIVEAVVGKDAADHLADGWLTPEHFREIRRVK